MSLTIAYLINQYPKVSHSFIRREITSVELTELRVLVFAPFLQHWAGWRSGQTGAGAGSVFLAGWDSKLTFRLLRVAVTRPILFPRLCGCTQARLVFRAGRFASSYFAAEGMYSATVVLRFGRGPCSCSLWDEFNRVAMLYPWLVDHQTSPFMVRKSSIKSRLSPW